MSGILNLDADPEGELVVNFWWPTSGGGFYTFAGYQYQQPGFILYVSYASNPSSTNPALWGGVQAFQFSGDGQAPESATGIPYTYLESPQTLFDPVNVAYRVASNELFVSNRYGNGAVSPGGGISRFTYNGPSTAPSFNSLITGNSLDACHQLAFSPTTGEMFVANLAGGCISRFTFDSEGNATANGVINLGQSFRGVAVSPDGSLLFYTQINNNSGDYNVYAYNLATTAVTTAIALGATCHFLQYRPGTRELYVANVQGELIWRLAVALDNTLSLTETISLPSDYYLPIGVAFSPDGLEMFAPTQTYGGTTAIWVCRFSFNSESNTWVPTTVFSTGSPCGGPCIVFGGGLFMPGTPTLVARDLNDNIVLTLTPTPNANGDYLQVGSVPFTCSTGLVISAYDWLQLFLSPATTLLWAGQVLRYDLSYTPVSGGWEIGEASQPIPICKGELRFRRSNAAAPEVYRF